jgi:hypothetical protein
MDITVNGYNITADLGDSENSEMQLISQLNIGKDESKYFEDIQEGAYNHLCNNARRECYKLANILGWNSHGATMIYDKFIEQIKSLKK